MRQLSSNDSHYYRSHQAQRGFTLLEMMIAFSLISLLFLALFSSFNTMSRGWDAADVRMLKTEDIRLISDFLRRQLGSAMVVRIESDIGPVYAFEGEEDVVRYAAPLKPLQQQGGVYLIELAVKSERKGKHLVMRYAPYRPELTWEEAFEGVDSIVVYEGFLQAEFQYLVAENLDDEPSWESSWKSEVSLPLLVKLTLADEERPWPEIITELPQAEDYLYVR